MLRELSDPRKTLTLMKSVGHAASHRLQPTQSSGRAAEAITPDLAEGMGIISSTSVGQALTHCVQPMQVSYILTVWEA